MGSAARLDSPLGFETGIELPEQPTLLTEIITTSLGWFSTNLQGMSFGLLFAAGILLLGPLVSRRLFLGRWSGTVAGVMVGAPLGVCANCAVPIASGLRAAGARIETALAAMISSPTLNIIVLTMMIALFPSYLVITRIAFTLLLLLLLIPLLVHYLRPSGSPPP